MRTDWREALEFFRERAAIREYLGEMPRDQAELAALADTEQWVTERALDVRSAHNVG